MCLRSYSSLAPQVGSSEGGGVGYCVGGEGAQQAAPPEAHQVSGTQDSGQPNALTPRFFPAFFSPPAVKKKESKMYGAHFKDVDHTQKSTKVTFDSDGDE